MSDSLPPDSLVWIMGDNIPSLVDTSKSNVWRFDPQAEQVEAGRQRVYSFTLDTEYHAGRMVNITDFMNKRDYPIWHVDLFVLDMQGREVGLLHHMLTTGLIKRFERLLVKLYSEASTEAIYNDITENMNKTHCLHWESNGWQWWEKR